jgi:VIT1/CCC1 family predicted Fe2+/Mn2+ transporter
VPRAINIPKHKSKKQNMRSILLHSETHLISRIGWLRAAVLGANDGLISTSSLIIGVAAASAGKGEIIIAGVAGIIAGAISMAAGEYVSVCSQSDTENADLARELKELEEDPESEIDELAQIYEQRGLDKNLAQEVAIQLTKKDALLAHARDELGISDLTKARPLQAAGASALTFAIGAILPLLIALISPLNIITLTVSTASIISLSLLGIIGAKLGKASIWRACIRVTFWGIFAMAFTAIIGKLFGAVI